MQSAALVGRTGSVDWLCLPRFDSDACFAALLGDEHNGHWRICPTSVEGPVSRQGEVSRQYVGDSLVLQTDWHTMSGKVRVLDFMPPRDDIAPVLVRIVEGIEGAVEMESVLRLRFGYGTAMSSGRSRARTRSACAARSR
jgi:GH15 family glucan-1,4-alpha-glucosidase